MADEPLDLDTLGSYLRCHVHEMGDLKGAEKFSDGQSNPTYLLDTESGQYVLRRQPPGELLKSAHAVDREFRVIKALQGSEVPVARAMGHVQAVMERGGPQAVRDLWRGGLPMAAAGRLATLFSPLTPDQRGIAAVLTLALGTMAALGILGAWLFA